MSKGRYFCGGSALAVTLALGVGAPGVAFAQDAFTAFTAADANGDLVLSAEEIEKLPEAFRDNAVDRDGNGQVTLAEYQAQADAAAPATTVAGVVAVGSRIRGNTEAQALPVEVIGRAEIEAQGSPSTEALIRNLSEIGNVQGQSARGTNAGGYGVSSINLRNLGSGRTLLTLNGRRLADDPNTNGGGANVTGGAQQNANSVPMEVLSQMEVLKDGGGATYGADAVGGVVNFVTRRDLDGFEFRSNYEWTDGSDGDYDLNLQWGKQREDNEGDFLVSFYYDHNSNIASGDVDYIRNTVGNFFNTPITSPAYSGLLGAYYFAPESAGATSEARRLAAIGTATAIRPGAAGVLAYTGSGTTNPVASATGLLRDDACIRLGGYRTWSTTAAPQCSYNRIDVDNVQDDQDTFRVFTSANFNLNDRFRFHTEANFSKTVITVTGLELALNSPCDPLPGGAPGATTGTDASRRDCTRVRQSTVQGYSVPGYNPAVRDYVLRYYNPADTARVFTPAQIESLTGAPLLGGCVGDIASSTLGAQCFNGGNTSSYVNTAGIGSGAGVQQGYVPSDGAGSVRYGRVILSNTFWHPWAARFNDAFASGKPTFKNQSQLFRTSQELQGDLGTLFGNQVDFTLSATYSRNITQLEGQGLLTDRLQRALNGFGTDLDNFGTDGCSVRETLGSRTYTSGTSVVTVTGVAYTVGAGGGAGDAEYGFNPGASAGNGCFFFNPFASSIETSLLNGETFYGTDTDVGFVSSTEGGYGGITGDYQGYAPGLGLQNSPGLVRWLYAYRENRSQSDATDIELTFNGQVENYELPGGPIQWALGGQYRYVHRTASTNRLNDRGINPCPFLSDEAEGLGTEGNIINPSSTCSGTNAGIFSPTSGPSGLGFRESVTHAVFTELSLPFLRNLNGTLRYRYEESKQAQTTEFQGASVVSGGLKYTVNPNFAIALDVSQTFDVPSIPEFDTDELVAIDNPTANDIFGNQDNVLLNPATRTFTVTNTAINPESGFNYTLRFLFQSQDRSFRANIDYYNITVSGRPVTTNASTIGRVLTGITQAGANPDLDLAIDCTDPNIARLFDPNFGPSVLGGAFVSYVDANGNPVAVGGNGCLTGTTLRGYNATGNDADLDGNAYNDGGDYALFIRAVDRLNSGDQHTSGIDIGADYTVPREVFGGQLALSADASWTLTLENATVFLFGIPVTAQDDLIGTQASGFAAQGNIWRGSLGATYRKGRHLFSLRGVFVGATTDRAIHGVDTATAPSTPSNSFYNLNPLDSSVCNNPIANGLPLPYLPLPLNPTVGPQAVGGAPLFTQPGNTGAREDYTIGTNGNVILVGEGAYNANCDLPQRAGVKVPHSFVLNATYRVELPHQTALSFTVDNLLDSDPPFQRYQYGYSPYSSATPYGRIFRVGLTKKFGGAAAE